VTPGRPGIVNPALNVARCVGQAVSSALGQSLSGIGLEMVNDASSDATGRLIPSAPRDAGQSQYGVHAPEQARKAGRTHPRGRRDGFHAAHMGQAVAPGPSGCEPKVTFQRAPGPCVSSCGGRRQAVPGTLRYRPAHCGTRNTAHSWMWRPLALSLLIARLTTRRGALADAEKRSARATKVVM
jgi:hypothetical protein